MSTDPGPPENAEDVLSIETDQQLHAIGNLVRHRVLRVLRDGPATVTQIAARLGIAKGSSNYHVKVLVKAGLIEVVETRKVRGVTELYYGKVGKVIRLPDGGAGQPDILMRHALADVESAPDGSLSDLRLKHLRLAPEHYELAVAKIVALHAELAELNDPTQPSADLFTALYRPRDLRQTPDEDPGAETDTASRPSPE